MRPTARPGSQLAAAIALALALVPGAAHAGTPLEFHAIIDGSLGRPPNNSSGRGVGHFTLDAEGIQLSYDIVFDPWINDELFAHIHVDSIGGGGSETILFDLPDGAHKVGIMTIESEPLRDALIAGHFFVVVHSLSHRMGELVGWILPGTPAAPATWGRVKSSYW